MTDPTNLFGPLISRNDVERAVIATLQEHMPGWLAEVTQRFPQLPSALPMPRSWQTVDALTDEPKDSTPAVVVAFREGALSHGNAGMLRAQFQGGVAVFNEAGAAVGGLGATSLEQSRWLAGTYLSVVMAVLAQHPDLGGVASRTVLTGFSADQVAGLDDDTQYAAGQVSVDVHVDDIIDPTRGPTDLYSPPDGALLHVETVEIETAPEDLQP